MTAREKIEEEIIRWNLMFPLDREYRKAHNITYASKQHREINQIDLYMQYIEDELYTKMYKDAKDEIESLREYDKGKWLKDEPDVEGEEADDLFDKLKVGDISNIKLED